MSPVLLVDGDQYLYRCCAAVEREVRWDDQNHVLYSNAEEAWDTVEGALRDLRDRFGTSEMIICMGEAPYFRHTLHPAYKAGRSRKPLCFPDVRARLKATYRCVEMPGIEADDVMGILATKPGKQEAIIVARDKDMKGVPAKLWDGGNFLNVTEPEANYFHMYQTLTGDVTDGYKGCPGIGPKKAEQVLDCVDSPTDYKGQWLAVSKAFENAGLTADDALLQARLARILRWSDWDKEKKEPILWTP